MTTETGPLDLEYMTMGQTSEPIKEPNPKENEELTQREVIRLGFTILAVLIYFGIAALGYFSEGRIWNAPDVIRSRGSFIIAAVCLACIFPLLWGLLFYGVSSWIHVLKPRSCYVTLGLTAKPRSKGPGVIWILTPFEKTKKWVSLAVNNLPLFRIETTDSQGWPITLNAKLEYIITEPVDAVYNVAAFLPVLRFIAEGVLFQVGSSNTYDDLRMKKLEMSKQLLELITKALSGEIESETAVAMSEYGIRVKSGNPIINYGVKILTFDLLDAKLSTEKAADDFQRAIALVKQGEGLQNLIGVIKNSIDGISSDAAAKLAGTIALASSGGGGSNLLIGT
jgi:hypothetical protein